MDDLTLSLEDAIILESILKVYLPVAAPLLDETELVKTEELKHKIETYLDRIDNEIGN